MKGKPVHFKIMTQLNTGKEGYLLKVDSKGIFITRMDKYLSSKGRRLIGWDEILEGGFAPQATVMSWRGYKGRALKQLNNIMM
jgi:hexosaminidase